MASGTPTVEAASSVAPVRSFTKSDTRIVSEVVLGAYVTDGIVVTEPADGRGMTLVAINVMNPVIDVGGDEIYSWNGSKTAPKITANVISTGAELGNGVATSSNPLYIEFFYGQ